MTVPQAIVSRDNPLIKRLRLLVNDSTAYRKQGQVCWKASTCARRCWLAMGGPRWRCSPNRTGHVPTQPCAKPRPTCTLCPTR